MRLIALKTLRDFWTAHPDVEQALRAWADEVRQAEWSQPTDIKERYASASVLKDRRVVFNVKGNQYRVVVAIAYQFRAVYVKFVGTHAEYDQIEADNVELSS